MLFGLQTTSNKLSNFKGKQLFDGRCYFIFHHVRKIVAFLLLLMVALLEYRIVFCVVFQVKCVLYMV